MTQNAYSLVMAWDSNSGEILGVPLNRSRLFTFMTELSAILVRTLVMWSGVRLGMIHSDLTVSFYV